MKFSNRFALNNFKRRKVLSLSVKTLRISITKEILSKISTNTPVNTNEISLDTAYKVAWALTASFQDVELTGSDVSFFEFDQYVTLRLKRNSGVLIIIAATYEQTCPVAALQRLFNQDLPSDASLFCCGDTVAFSRRYVIDKASPKLRVSCLGYSGHSFRRELHSTPQIVGCSMKTY